MTNAITKERKNFAIIPNGLLNDNSVSLAAKGIYAFMESKPSTWNFTIRSMAKQLKEGESAIRSALNDLRKSNWVTYEKHSDGRGTYHLIWEKEEPKLENPHLGDRKPSVDNPMMGNPTRISKKEPIVRNITTSDLAIAVKKPRFNPLDVRPNNLTDEQWAEWVAYRRERRLSCSKMTIERQIKMLESESNPYAIIDRSITNGWQGLFAEKNGGKSDWVDDPSDVSWIYKDSGL